MKSDDEIVQANIERALQALHTVADLCRPDDGKESNTNPGVSNSEDEKYLTVREVAERIKYGEQTLRNMMSAGVFKRGVHYLKRRRRVVFLWSSVEQWLREDPVPSMSSERSHGVEERRSDDNDDQPFYPVHHARSRKRRQALL